MDILGRGFGRSAASGGVLMPQQLSLDSTSAHVQITDYKVAPQRGRP